MATKSNIRSIRFSDDIAELIDRQAGDNFTQKFENLITRCVWELPQKEAELTRVQERIERERGHLKELVKEVNKLDDLIRNLQPRYETLRQAIEREIEKM